MDQIEKLTQRLQGPMAYPCLHLLEGAVASWNYWTGEIPAELTDDIRAALGNDVVEGEISSLLAMGVLEEVNTAEAPLLRLKQQYLTDAASRLQSLRCHMELEVGGVPMTAQGYLDQLVQYLQSAVPRLIVQEYENETCRLELEGETYRLQLSFSPFWLPLATEREESEEKYLIVFGPFASQFWEKMYHYCDMEVFRNRVGMYDPWRREKVNLCKGSLPVYIDWFMRDRFESKFSIPPDFCDALHNLGLMRYNDER